jgi:hypothetical protein
MYRASRFYDVTVIEADRSLTADVLAVQVCAVGAAQVLDVELLAVQFNLEMSSGDEPQVIQIERSGEVTPAYDSALARKMNIDAIG